MLLTEKEAKEKWCPMTRIGLSSGDALVSVNSHPDVDTDFRCRGLQCAIFRLAPDATKTLGNGLIAVVDGRDADVLSRTWWWHGRYVKGKGTYLHRAVIEKHMGDIPPGMVIDHIDGDSLNNRLGNLRVCRQAENLRNNKGRLTARSKFKGVYPTASGRWSAQFTYSGTRVCLGTFNTEAEAADAYDEAVADVGDAFLRMNMGKVADARRGYCGLAGKPEEA